MAIELSEKDKEMKDLLENIEKMKAFLREKAKEEKIDDILARIDTMAKQTMGPYLGEHDEKSLFNPLVNCYAEIIVERIRKEINESIPK